MILCKSKNDYEISEISERSQWVERGKITKKYPNLDPRYIFINSGFNLRPTDIQASIGISQFQRLEKFKKISL